MRLNGTQEQARGAGAGNTQPRSWRKAKIVCTIGPSSSSEAMLRELMRLGMDVARLNFSHGTHEEHARVIERVRKAAEKEGRPICILQDLQGPKIRTGRLKQRTPVALKAGSHVTITPRDIAGTATLLATTYPNLARDVEPGSRILLADGLIELRVRAVRGADVACEVVNGGMLGEHKGINLPGTAMSVPSLSEKDMVDLAFGLKHDVDAVAVSFIRTADDVLAAKKYIAAKGGSVPVIAKLEKPQAIEHLEEIFDAADGVMVARGDLGVEVPAEKVPVMQKHIIRRASEWRKPVITATQMLESMVENPRPTRAEASDVANAIFDGSDAVMLSAESASGKYPREAVAMMARIIAESESHILEQIPHRRLSNVRRLSIQETICESVAHAAQDLEMRAIAVFTETGTTARLISKFRPKAHIFAFTANQAVCNRMTMLWGVQPTLCEHAPSAEDMLRVAENELLGIGAVHPGDVMGIVAGTQRSSGSTNFMRLHVVGAADTGPPDRRRVPRLRPLPERKKH
ncbi:MAG: pyruvate kinase [Acidobacteriia bacterium]|nr:pyruvate kinase [Terriglobia bacterium]